MLVSVIFLFLSLIVGHILDYAELPENNFVLSVKSPKILIYI